MTWSECEVSSQTLLSCLREATEERVKEKEYEKKKEGRSGRRVRLASACLQAAGHRAGER